MARQARGHREQVTVVGTLPEVRAGEWLEAQGRGIVNKEYGQQFEADVLRTMPPTTVEGIEKCLASGMIKGIGPVLAARIVRAYKERAFEIIDADPHRLKGASGRWPCNVLVPGDEHGALSSRLRVSLSAVGP